jgi:hypothetical protein
MEPRAHGLGLLGLGPRVQGLGIRPSGSKVQSQGLGLRVLGLRVRV